MAGFYIHHADRSALQTQQGSANLAITRALANAAAPHLAAVLQRPMGATAADLQGRPDVAMLDHAVRSTLHGTGVVQLRIHAADGRTVYASDRARIGDNQRTELAFQRALEGEVLSSLHHRDRVDALEGQLEDVDLVVTHVPFAGADPSRPKAVFEVHADVTPLVRQIDQRRVMLLATVFGAWVLFGLGVFVRAGLASDGGARRAGPRRTADPRAATDPKQDAASALPDRAALLERLGAAVERARRDANQRFVLVVIDVDRFSSVNQRFGRALGDRLLRRVARRLKPIATPRGELFRCGVDAFALVQAASRSDDEVDAIAQRMLATLASGFSLDEGTVSITASAGVAVFEGKGSAAEWLSRAEAALDQARSEGGARFVRHRDAPPEPVVSPAEVDASARLKDRVDRHMSEATGRRARDVARSVQTAASTSTPPRSTQPRSTPPRSTPTVPSPPGSQPGVAPIVARVPGNILMGRLPLGDDDRFAVVDRVPTAFQTTMTLESLEPLAAPEAPEREPVIEKLTLV